MQQVVASIQTSSPSYSLGRKADNLNVSTEDNEWEIDRFVLYWKGVHPKGKDEYSPEDMVGLTFYSQLEEEASSIPCAILFTKDASINFEFTLFGVGRRYQHHEKGNLEERLTFFLHNR